METAVHLDKEVFIRHRRQFEPCVRGFAEDVDALVSLAQAVMVRGRVCIFVTPPLDNEQRTKLCQSLAPNRWTATIGTENAEFDGNHVSYNQITLRR